MRILHVINSLCIGGAEKLLTEIIPLQNKGNIADTLLLNGAKCPFKKYLIDNGYLVHSVGMNNNIYNPIIILKIIPYLKKYDVIHVHLFPAQYWIIFAKLISFSKVKLITTEHNTYNRRRNIIFFKYLDKFIYSFFDKIICISPEVKQSLCEYLPILNKSAIIIYNGINLDVYKKAKGYTKSDFISCLKENDKLIVQVSRFSEQKDQDTVIKAIKILHSDYYVAFIGDGNRKNICEKLAFNLGVSDRVHFLGNRMDIPAILKTSDLVILSSHWEGFGLAAVEGMASERPILVSNVPGLSEVVANSECLFTSGNSEELAFKIQEIFSSNQKYNANIMANTQKAFLFDINNMVIQYEEVYLSL
ncbi:N-acetyl-alpha-D-glucosaminyl L-malate synthase [termite gut metagenome]|uniref:N-acetyl-alpha-D-glucosaminyl L-malate synthase n=1 Tax=termite gut metagenome TaxID=433724 RepID=A0A5J4R6K4_9ZZZZ